MTVSLQKDTVKKQAELKDCEIFIRKYFLQVINMGDGIVRPIFL